MSMKFYILVNMRTHAKHNTLDAFIELVKMFTKFIALFLSYSSINDAT